MFSTLKTLPKKIINKLLTRKFSKTMRENKKRKILRSIILKDPNLKMLGIQNIIKEIVESHILTHPIDYIFREIASFIVNIGHSSYAKPYFKLSLQYNNTALTYSLYLQSLLVDPFSTDADIYNESIKYNQYYSHIEKYTSYSNELNPNKIIKVAYICHFFSNSVSQSLLMPFIKAHNRNRVQVYCYSDTEPHEVNDTIKKCADVWRDTKHLNDHALAELIREDEIDILLELNGHIILNRYGVVARKAAPIQINYYNQSATTGLTALDYILIGENIHLNQQYYTETICQIKGLQGIAIFPDSFPPISLPPCLKNNYITFGSFGAAHKVNTEVVKLWCKVLKAVPNSKFFMKAGVLTFKSYLDVYKRLFYAEGINLNRIRFEGFSDHSTMLQAYADVDIALDTIPHNAGTTTLEAIWQGVPVITLCGQRYCSQNGRIVLTSIGHPELVTYSEKAYIEKAVELASNKEQLIKYRSTLRDDFKRSSLADANDFSKRLEDVFVNLWQKYCQTKVAIQDAII